MKKKFDVVVKIDVSINPIEPPVDMVERVAYDSMGAVARLHANALAKGLSKYFENILSRLAPDKEKEYKVLEKCDCGGEFTCIDYKTSIAHNANNYPK